ncbi:2',3'-cyclic-nucleotide 3'-phosphodiesterase [Heptranchias perlo]|uniref:2',3'-cyclic-nucleotide 3'-phosphodiesterase n=1 Tax=Heptranchias perlo TaxID=212740 RepID=UPI00355AB9ED
MRCGIRSLIRNVFKMGVKQSKPKMCSDFPFLSDDNTIEAIKEANTLFILRGLPGSGKTTVAKDIAKKYKAISTILSAHDFKISPLVDESEADCNQYAKLDGQIQQEIKNNRGIIVVDDTHHNRKRLDCLFDLVGDSDYIVIIVAPKTEWRNDYKILAKQSTWKPPVEKLEDMGRSFEEHIIPYYFGWFLIRKNAKEMRKAATDFLNQLSESQEFLKEFVKYAEGHSEEDFNLQEYFQKRPSVLHCTTKFCNYGEVPDCASYAQCEVVEQSYSKSFVLKVTALFVTPRTVGARVQLDEQQQQLWPKGEVCEREGCSDDEADLPVSSRSHITLACAPGVKSVQTGLDLLEILMLEKSGNKPEWQGKTEKGELYCYGKGRWIVHLPEPIEVKTIFSGFYRKKNVQPTTESEGN